MSRVRGMLCTRSGAGMGAGMGAAVGWQVAQWGGQGYFSANSRSCLSARAASLNFCEVGVFSLYFPFYFSFHSQECWRCRVPMGHLWQPPHLRHNLPNSDNQQQKRGRRNACGSDRLCGIDCICPCLWLENGSFALKILLFFTDCRFGLLVWVSSFLTWCYQFAHEAVIFIHLFIFWT